LCRRGVNRTIGEGSALSQTTPLPDSPSGERLQGRGAEGKTRAAPDLLDSLPALVWETDRDLRFTRLTGATLSAMGIAGADYRGRPVADFFSGAQAAEIRVAHQVALLGETGSFGAEAKGRELRGTVRPAPDSEGGVAGVIGVALDLTERIVAERALRLSEYGYRSMVEEAPYAICRCTMAGQLLQVNRAMAEMLGYDRQTSGELLLRDLPQIFSAPEAFESLQKNLVDHGSQSEADAVWRRRDGSEIQVRVSGRVACGAGAEISHFDIFAEDVTEKKRLEAELSQAQKMQAVGQLAGGVAHDFNNLLTVIAGHVELLLENAGGPARERLMEIRLASEKAAGLTRQLLAFSRRQVLRSRTVDLNQIAGNLMGLLGRVMRQDIDLVFEPGADTGCVNADPHEIERVLMNLAVNAQDAMPAGGRLTIRTARVTVRGQRSRPPDAPKAGEYAQLIVQDTGVGMDQETQARIFEPFFTTKAPHEGTGLGLAVVYGIIRQSGGYIHVESQPGAGTTFRICLPRVATEPAPPPAQPSVTKRLPHGSETILVAEDDASIRALVGRALEALGYQVISATDGLAALKLAEQHAGTIHLLLTDLIMPGLGGHELAVRLHSLRPELKVVFISGYAGQSPPGRELENRIFLQKPFSLDALAGAIRAALDGSGG